MSEPVIAFDESGNTGPDLLNIRQPIFTLASVRLEEHIAEELLAPFSRFGEEAKFSVLRRDPDGQKRLLEFLGSEFLTDQTARASVFHKPYTVVAKMVDLLMEPGFYERGLTEKFFAEDGALLWPNTLYELAGEQLGDLWPALQRAFIVAVRKPSASNTEKMKVLLVEAAKGALDARVEFPLEVMAEQASKTLGSTPDVDPLDPAIPALVEHMDAWGRTVGAFAVAHDHSGAIERTREHLLRLCDPTHKPYEINGPDEPARFPLKATRIDLVDSTDIMQVQVADLLAGACSFQQGAFQRQPKDAAFARAIAETGIRRLFEQFVAPVEFVRRSMQGVEEWSREDAQGA